MKSLNLKTLVLAGVFAIVTSVAYATFTTPTSWQGIGQSPIFDAARCQAQWYTTKEANCSVVTSTQARCVLHGLLEGDTLRISGTVTGSQFLGNMDILSTSGQYLTTTGTAEFQTGVARPSVFYTFSDGKRAQCDFRYNGNNLTAYYTGYW